MARVTKSEERKSFPVMAAATATAFPATTSSAAGVASGPASSAEERELIRRAQTGEVEAYEELLRRHQGKVFAVIGGVLRHSEDVEDVAQQVFLKVYVALKRFDYRSTFSTWLYKVAMNECLDHLRKKKVRKLVYEADMSEEQAQLLESAAQPDGASVAANAERTAELRQLVERLLEKLPEEERVMMVLKEVEGWTVEEVAELLGLNVNTVKVRLFRARVKLAGFYRKRMSGPASSTRKQAGNDV
jgi:RNA polymerase sigma-70 factor (ECF subfamily)